MQSSMPTDIPVRPDLQGTIPIETAPPPGPSTAASTTTTATGQPMDVAGVLRRNQACLACRRRKLKCDAIRPHCSTCVRSYRHLLRTAPGTHPVLTCDYDDAVDREHGGDGERTSPTDGDEDDGRKKKRKSSGGRPKKREEELDEERDRLAKRIAELEEQLANKAASPPTARPAQGTSRPVPTSASASASAAMPAPTSTSRWTGSFMSQQAESPTAFLEMLSSAASTAHSAAAPGHNVLGGITPMWTSSDRTEVTGLTPFLPMPDPDDNPAASTSTSSNEAANGRYRPQTPQMLSPNGIFNFSPAPSGPAAGAVPEAFSINSVLGVANQLGSLTGIAAVGGSPMPGDITGTQTAPIPADVRMNIDNAATSLANGETIEEIGAGGGERPPKRPRTQSSSTSADPIGAMGVDGMLDSQTLMDLFWPGWPPNLPDPPIVQQLVEAFFDIVPNMPRMLHRGRFLSRLSLPATHSNFPHPSLLHAICALAASWCNPEVYEHGPPPNFDSKMAFFTNHPPRRPQPTAMPFSLQQAAHGKDAVLDGLNTGNRLFDVVRAMIILSRVFIDDTRMLECWTYCGLVSRMILPLGLNVRSAELSLKSVMLPPAADALEREERRVVVWMAMYHDTVASAASGWGTSLALDELTVPFPVSRKEFESGQDTMEPNPQDLESLDLYIKHPVADSLVMALKAAVLLNRVNKFARKWKNRRLRENDDLDGMQRPEFRELANAIACLQMSFPLSLTNPTTLDHRGMLDVDLVSAHVVPHTAIICLYEPFADVTDPNDQPARRILNAARSVINVIQQLVGVVPKGVSNIGAVMHSSSSVALVTAARTCLLFYRHALNLGDMATAEAYRMDVETARVALAQYGRKFKIGYHHAQLIEYFLDRATNPTYDKLAAHYPEHPRAGALPLTPDSNFGMCILNALNIKRGYWKLPLGGQAQAAGSISTASPHGVSPTNSTGDGNKNTDGVSPPDLPHRLSTSSGASNSPASNAVPGSNSSSMWNGSTGSASGASAHANGVAANGSGAHAAMYPLDKGPETAHHCLDTGTGGHVCHVPMMGNFAE